jgi:nucleoside-diphosphate-sugar epimerase
VQVDASSTAVVIGGAGRVGRGIGRALRALGWRVIVVDPAGGPEDLAAVAHPDLAADDLAEPADLVVISLPARGAGRAAGEFRPSEVAADELAGRLDALDLALRVLGEANPTVVELGSSALLGTGAGEADLIASWQRRVHHGLAGLPETRHYLCAITTPVTPFGAPARSDWPGAERIGEKLLELVRSGRPAGVWAIGADLDWQPVEAAD